MSFADPVDSHPTVYSDDDNDPSFHHGMRRRDDDDYEQEREKKLSPVSEAQVKEWIEALNLENPKADPAKNVPTTQPLSHAIAAASLSSYLFMTTIEGKSIIDLVKAAAVQTEQPIKSKSALMLFNRTNWDKANVADTFFQIVSNSTHPSRTLAFDMIVNNAASQQFVLDKGDASIPTAINQLLVSAVENAFLDLSADTLEFRQSAAAKMRDIPFVRTRMILAIISALTQNTDDSIRASLYTALSIQIERYRNLNLVLNHAVFENELSGFLFSRIKAQIDQTTKPGYAERHNTNLAIIDIDQELNFLRLLGLNAEDEQSLTELVHSVAQTSDFAQLKASLQSLAGARYLQFEYLTKTYFVIKGSKHLDPTQEKQLYNDLLTYRPVITPAVKAFISQYVELKLSSRAERSDFFSKANVWRDEGLWEILQKTYPDENADDLTNKSEAIAAIASLKPALAVDSLPVNESDIEKPSTVQALAAIGDMDIAHMNPKDKEQLMARLDLLVKKYTKGTRDLHGSTAEELLRLSQNKFFANRWSKETVEDLKITLKLLMTSN